MRINNNLMAMNTHRQLGMANTGGAKSMEKLSSGLRINRAGDDAAGLAISEKMRGQIRGLNQASTNAQDGISLIQTTEGALNETHAILQRMRELAVQSSTDTNTDADRTNIQDEINQLSEEITRIATTTEFNTMKLLDGSFEGKKFHIGANQQQNISFDVNNMTSKALDLTSETNKYSKGLTGSGGVDTNINIYTHEGKGIEVEFKHDTNAGSGASVSVGDDGKLTVSFDKDKTTFENLQKALADHGAYLEVKTSGSKVQISGLNNATAKVGNFNQFSGKVGVVDAKITNSEIKEIKVITDKNAADISAELGKDGVLTITVSSGATHSGAALNKALKDAEVTGVTFETGTGIGAGTTKIELKASEEGKETKPVTIGIDVSTQANANKAITTINNALENVSKERSKLGAIQNRLEHTIKNLDTSSENLQASEARIRDVDMAKEMMEQTKQNILQQASTAMLAQANANPQTVLSLLR